MANEAVIIELLGSDKGEAIRFTCVNGTAIPKGTILKLSTPRTAAITSADGDYFCGIAAAAKVADDGATTIAAYTKGIFDLYAPAGNGGITAGQMVKTSGANLIVLADNDTAEEQGQIVGMAMEDAADTVAETISVAVGVYQ